jgi:hypothetical protein
MCCEACAALLPYVESNLMVEEGATRRALHVEMAHIKSTDVPSLESLQKYALDFTGYLYTGTQTRLAYLSEHMWHKNKYSQICSSAG